MDRAQGDGGRIQSSMTRMQRARPPVFVAAGYGLAGTAWIVVSDWLLALLVPDEHTLFLQTLKGVGFVAVTSVALYLVLGRVLDARGARAEAALAEEIRRRIRDQRRLTHRLMRAEEQTRQAVAKDLHDGPLQALTLTFMQLDAAARAREDGEALDPHLIAEAMGAVREASDDIRAVVSSLHPPLLAELGLAAAVERQCREASQRTGRDVVYTGDSALPPLPADASIAAFRILQEALANALKHTSGGRIEVALRADGDGLRLQVIDAGPGFHPDAARGAGLGLVSMRERAESVGGVCSLRSSPSGGTRVDVRLPLAAAVGD